MDNAALLDAWDKLDRAAQRMIVALPSSMTKASEQLDEARLEFRDKINNFIFERNQ